MNIVITDSYGVKEKYINVIVSFVGSAQNHYALCDYERKKIYEKRKRVIKKLLSENG